MICKTLTLCKEVDRKKFKELVKNGFGKDLADDYFDVLPESAYIIEEEGRYLGAILLFRIKAGAYLDKFVVAKEYQGNGIGRDLWAEMSRNEKKIFWRAKPNNPINKFYASVCDGMQKTDGWFIYWVGLTPGELKEAIIYALAKRETVK